jgi:hypothetical protein
VRLISFTDWVALALAVGGFVISAMDGDFFLRLGGSLTLLALVVAVYGFVSRDKKRKMGSEHHE